MKSKKIIYFLLALFLATTLFTGCAGFKEEAKTVQVNNNEVTFRFVADYQKKIRSDIFSENDKIDKVWIAGSFNSWKKNKDWYLTKDRETNVWTLTKKLKETLIPGNSGLPEYAFCVTKNGDNNVNWLKPGKEVPDGYKVSDQWTGHFNYIVMNGTVTPQQIKKINKLVTIVKKKYNSKYEAANFRELLAKTLKSKMIYRSYHPFKTSRKYSEEKQRLQGVADLMKKHKVKSVINLADNDKAKDNKNIPAYYRDLINKNSVLFAETKYSTVYFHSSTDKFASFLSRVVKFMLKKDAPFLIHCRLGTDRTGVITGMVAALGGAKWDEISTDYAKSNDAGMGEYRSPTLLKYSLETMLKVKIDNTTDIQKLLSEYLISKKAISKNEFKKFKNKFSK